MNLEGLAGLYMLVSFNCDHCTAVLSIPEEQSGISGPCPFCGTVVTSPLRPSAVEVPDMPLASDDPPASHGESPRRVWREPQVIPVQQPQLPFRPQRIALKVAACVALFVGGVAGTWKIWHGDKPRAENGEPVSETQPATTPRPASAAVTGATDSLPPPSDDIPRAPSAVPPAVARNVSTAPSPRVSVPPSAEAPTLFPDTGSGVQTQPAGTPAKAAETPALSAEEKRIRS